MNERLRVTSVIKGLGPGGAERLLVEVARAMPDVDGTVIYALSGKQHLVGDLQRAGVDVRPLDVRRLADIRWLPRLVRQIRATRPDVVHVHSPALAPFVRVAARARLLGRHRPLVVATEHNAWSTYRLPTRVLDAITTPLDDATFAVSDEVRDSIRPAALRRRVRALRHGIDVDAVRALGADREERRRELGIEPHELVVITVANYRAQKNYPSLLRAAQLVTAEEPRTRFVAIGQGPLADPIHALHEELGLGRRFLLLGHRADAAAVLAAGDIFCLSSDYEGLPVALMEATAHGLAVVATAVGGVAETIDASSGRLVPPGSPEALAEALLTVVRDDELRATLGEGSAVLGRTFDVGPAAVILEQTYRDLAGRRRRRPAASPSG